MSFQNSHETGNIITRRRKYRREYFSGQGKKIQNDDAIKNKVKDRAESDEEEDDDDDSTSATQSKSTSTAAAARTSISTTAATPKSSTTAKSSLTLAAKATSLSSLTSSRTILSSSITSAPPAVPVLIFSSTTAKSASISTTPLKAISTLILPISTVARSTPSNAISSEQSAQHPGHPNPTALIFAGIAACLAAALILIFAIYLIRRHFRSHHLQSQTQSADQTTSSFPSLSTSSRPFTQIRDDRSTATRSIWGTSSSYSSSEMEQNRPEMPQYIPPITMARNGESPLRYGEAADEERDISDGLGNCGDVNDAVERQERLGRVRASLLGERELSLGLGGVGASARRNKPPSTFPKIFSRSWRSEGSQNEGNLNVEKGIGDGRGLGVTERERVDIEAGGMWEEPVTVAARDSRVDSVASMPRWRDPITWARDQATRNSARR